MIHALRPYTAAILLLFVGCSGVIDEADTIYTNGRIYTVNEAQPWVEAVAIRDGVFSVVGSNADVEAVTGDGAEVVDLGGRFVMPGMVDLHTHLWTGVEMGTGAVNLTDPGDPEAIAQAVADFIAANPNKDVVLGGSWLVGGIVESNDSPDKALLDAVAPDVPVFLLSQSGHSAWVNSAALEMAGIDESFENTSSYIFDRYPGTSEPSGTVRESAMVLIMNALHYMSPEEFATFLPDEVARYSRQGVTAMQTAEGSPSWYRAAAILELDGRFNLRVFPAADWLTSQLRALDDDETRTFIDDLASYETELIKPHYVKLFADGGADSHTLLMKEPYADAPETHGSMYRPVQEYREAILEMYSNDISVHVHAMGDSTASLIIDIFEEAAATYPDSRATLHFGHAPSIDDRELDRLAAIEKASMNFSPMLAVPHLQMELFLETPLGPERYQQIYPVRSAIERGITVGFGGDFPSSLVPEPDQFWYMEGWVTRAVPGSPEYGTNNPDQAIPVEQAIRAFTLGGAEALGRNYSDEFGSIEVGKSADMIVLDRNLLEIPESEIHQTEVEQTLFQGRVVHER